MDPNNLLPFVRHMLICEHAEPSRHNPRRADIFGLFANVVLRDGLARFPCSIGFSVYVMLTDCRQDGVGRIVVSDAESGEACYSGIPHRVLLNANPLEVHGVIFRIPECHLPRPGLYWIELEFNGTVLCQEPILLAVR